MSEQETRKDNNKPQESSRPKGGGRRGGGNRPRGDRARTKPAPSAGQSQPATAARPGDPGKQARSAIVLAVVALVIGVGVAVTAFFTWREVDRTVAGQQQATQQSELRSSGLEARLQDTARRMDGIQLEVDRQLDSARRSQRDQLAAMGDKQEDVEKSVALLRAQMGRSQDGWLLAEVEYLLRIGNQRLQLQRDVDTAQAALMAADDRLRELADPGYLPVREALAREIADLKSAPRTDISGLALVLGGLAERVDGLQLAGARYVPASERHGDPREVIAASDWREVPMVVWNAVRRLFAIRTLDEPATPMLSPDHQYFLYQNLRLVLEAARVALLQGDSGSYRTSLATAQRWLGKHFDADDPATGAMHKDLARLAEMDIRPALPDISASLRLLRQQLALTEAATTAITPPPQDEVVTNEPVDLPAKDTDTVETPAADTGSGETAANDDTAADAVPADSPVAVDESPAGTDAAEGGAQ